MRSSLSDPAAYRRPMKNKTLAKLRIAYESAYVIAVHWVFRVPLGGWEER
jgi:hypothetical protein